MRRRVIAVAVLTLAVVGPIYVSCGASERAQFDAQSSDAGGAIDGFAQEGGGDGGSITCSRDLRSILDPNGNTLRECPPDQGCAHGDCVPACQSAEENKTSIGCDYWVAAPDIIPFADGACFAAFVANTWVTPVKIEVERAGQKLDVRSMTRIPSGSGKDVVYAPLPNDELPPGAVAIVFLARHGTELTSCPAGVVPGFTSAPANIAGTGIGEAFHITTSSPVVAYDIYPYGGGDSALTSATLLLPSSAWGTNYIGVNAFRKSRAVPNATLFLQIVARENATEVRIKPKYAIDPDGGIPGTPAGAVGTYTLDRGQLLQLGQVIELTGSVIESDKPVAVFGGASCMNIDVTDGACDGAHQQLPPIRALGSQYVAVRHRDRYDGLEESPPWRIVGAVDGTRLTWEPAAPPDAPSTLSLGEVVEFRSPGPFIVKSQDAAHPFYMSAHMTGCNAIHKGEDDCRGDPEFVNVVPSDQYLRRYVFFTDPTYPETNLVVVRAKVKGRFEDVTLDCAGKLGGWKPLGEFEYTRFDLVRGNFEKQGACDNGRHEMTSDAPFALTVWGWGSGVTGELGGDAGVYTQYVSYAYPGGTGIEPVNGVVVSTSPK